MHHSFETFLFFFQSVSLRYCCQGGGQINIIKAALLLYNRLPTYCVCMCACVCAGGEDNLPPDIEVMVRGTYHVR